MEAAPPRSACSPAVAPRTPLPGRARASGEALPGQPGVHLHSRPFLPPARRNQASRLMPPGGAIPRPPGVARSRCPRAGHGNLWTRPWHRLSSRCACRRIRPVPGPCRRAARDGNRTGCRPDYRIDHRSDCRSDYRPDCWPDYPSGWWSTPFPCPCLGRCPDPVSGRSGGIRKTPSAWRPRHGCHRGPVHPVVIRRRGYSSGACHRTGRTDCSGRLGHGVDPAGGRRPGCVRGRGCCARRARSAGCPGGCRCCCV